MRVIALIEGRHVFFRAGESVLFCFIADATEKETVLPSHGARGRIHFAFEVEANNTMFVCKNKSISCHYFSRAYLEKLHRVFLFYFQ